MTFEQELPHYFHNLLKIRVFFSILSKDFPILDGIFSYLAIVILMMNFDIFQKDTFPLHNNFFFHICKLQFLAISTFPRKEKEASNVSRSIRYMYSYLPYPHRGKPSFLDSISTAADIQVRRVQSILTISKNPHSAIDRKEKG